jgi:hypothetical protein
MNRIERDCERVEASLPGFVERTLVPDEAGFVAAHVDSCARCRESLAAFLSLEEALVSRRDEVPPFERFLPDVALSRPVGAQPSLLLRFFRVVMSVPGLAVVLVVWGTLFAGRYRDRLADDVLATTSPERWGAFGRVVDFCNWIGATLMNLARGDEWTLIAIYATVTIAVLASASAVTLRMVRS